MDHKKQAVDTVRARGEDMKKLDEHKRKRDAAEEQRERQDARRRARER